MTKSSCRATPQIIYGTHSIFGMTIHTSLRLCLGATLVSKPLEEQLVGTSLFHFETALCDVITQSIAAPQIKPLLQCCWPSNRCSSRQLILFLPARKEKLPGSSHVFSLTRERDSGVAQSKSSRLFRAQHLDTMDLNV